MTKDNSIIKLNVNSEEYKQGAIDCKSSLLEMQKYLNAAWASSEYDSNINSDAINLNHRAIAISDFVLSLGDLTPHQQGLISALAEYAEISISGMCINPDQWEPSCISGKWQ